MKNELRETYDLKNVLVLEKKKNNEMEVAEEQDGLKIMTTLTV